MRLRANCSERLRRLLRATRCAYHDTASTARRTTPTVVQSAAVVVESMARPTPPTPQPPTHANAKNSSASLAQQSARLARSVGGWHDSHPCAPSSAPTRAVQATATRASAGVFAQLAGAVRHAQKPTLVHAALAAHRLLWHAKASLASCLAPAREYVRLNLATAASRRSHASSCSGQAASQSRFSPTSQPTSQR